MQVKGPTGVLLSASRSGRKECLDLRGNAEISAATGGQGRGKTESKRLLPFSLVLLVAASGFFLSISQKLC